MILIDGYNLIYASEELSGLASGDLEAAREELIRRLADYAAARGTQVDIVFDGAGRGGGSESTRRSALLTVTFTRAGKTADAYIEGLSCGAGESGSRGATVVTGDYEQQKVVLGAGMLRMSSREFLEEMRECEEETRVRLRERSRASGRVRLDRRLPDDVKDALIRLRNRDKA